MLILVTAERRIGLLMDGARRAARWCGAAMVGAVVLGLVVPGGARAATAPAITAGPVIDGAAQVGAVLTAKAAWTGDPSPTATWKWLRCAKPTGSCPEIDGATGAKYRVVPADVGSVLRVRLAGDQQRGVGREAFAAHRRGRCRPTPTPTPTPDADADPAPTATPEPTPTAVPTPAFDDSVAPAAAPPAPAGAPERTVSRAPMLEPFPIVRIKGVFTASGAHVSLLSVRAPRGARVKVACRGRDCPLRRFKARAGVKRLRPFERDLRAGTRLEVTVTKPGYIGKVTVIVIRRHAAPRRSDRCLEPGARRAVRCPTG